MAIERTFGDWLRMRRKEFGYTQEELADMVGCSPAMIRKIESGNRRPSRQVAELLAESLDIPQDERPRFLRLARSEASMGGVATVPPPVLPGTMPVPNGALTAPGHAPGDMSVNGRAAHVVPPTNLPIQLTPLIGREALLNDVSERLLRPEVRLLTLLGPPGIGKTRLAVEVASQVMKEFPDGAFFVGLSAVTDPALVMNTIAQTLGVKEHGSQTVTAGLIEQLRDSRMLLLLDNFEQVVGAATVVADLLAACPEVKALVTSREALNVRGERQFPVPPLAMPDPTHLPAMDVLREYPAIQLFLERAVSVHPGFELTDENAPIVAELCARLDGLPLAIELVAARVRLLSPSALLSRLHNRLALLTGGQRDLPARQRTLRSAIEWSYDLLTPPEQKLFARMGVFIGGCTLAAAEAVCNPTGDLGLDVFDGLESLLNKSLIQQVAPGDDGAAQETRFTILETIREYAVERLEQNGEADEIRQAHAEYCLALAAAAETNLMGREQEQWLLQLVNEHDNMRTVLRWALDEGEYEIAMRLSGLLGRFWSLHGHLTEGRMWLEEILSKRSIAPIEDRARAFQWAGTLARKQDNYDIARDFYDRSLILYREMKDLAGTAEVLEHLSLLCVLRGDYEQGVRLGEETLELSRKLGDGYKICRALYMLGAGLIYRGDIEKGEEYSEEGLALARSINNTEMISDCMNALGVSAHWKGKYEQAERYYEESLRRAREVNDQLNIAQITGNQAELALHMGHVSKSHKLYIRSLLAFMELGGRLGISEGVMGIAMVAGSTGNLEKAAVLHGAAEAMRQSIGTPVPPFARPVRDRYISEVREQLGEAAWQAAWERGEHLPYERVLELALEDDTED